MVATTDLHSDPDMCEPVDTIPGAPAHRKPDAQQLVAGAGHGSGMPWTGPSLLGLRVACGAVVPFAAGSGFGWAGSVCGWQTMARRGRTGLEEWRC